MLHSRKENPKGGPYPLEATMKKVLRPKRTQDEFGCTTM